MVSSSGHICLLTDTADRAVLLSLLQGSRWFERPELLSGDLSQSVDVVVFAYAETISPDEVVRRLLASGHHPSVRPVVIIATNLSLPDAALFLRYGIRGMLDATELTPSVLHKCLDCVAAGELWAHQAQLLHLMSELSPLRPSNKARHAARLTIREHEVLSCLAEGLTNHEIGERLGVSDHTVKTISLACLRN